MRRIGLEARSAALCAATVALLGVAGAAPAWAAPTCGTTAQFNSQGIAATRGTLKFRLTGMTLAGVLKHHLAVFDDPRTKGAAGYPCTGIDFKTWGTAAGAADIGTVKDELFNTCCTSCGTCSTERTGSAACETWPGPRPSPAVFTGPAQTCDITLDFTPTTIGYLVACTPGTTISAQGNNQYGLQVSRLSVPIASEATVTNEEFCYETSGGGTGGGAGGGGAGGGSGGGGGGAGGGLGTKVSATADVTVTGEYPSSVYPEVTDLSVGAPSETAYLKFDLSSVPGRVISAQLFVRTAAASFAAGDGANALAVIDNSWSESTLSWSARPPTVGTTLARVAGAQPDQWYSFDVTTAVSAPRVYSFALAPGASDTNAIHFLSKEAGAATAPYLQVGYEIVDADGDGSPAGPDCNDSSPAVHPGAVEACNGIDDDCDRAIDEGCPVQTDAGAGPDSGSSLPDAGADAGVDAGVVAAVDAGVDAGPIGPADAGSTPPSGVASGGCASTHGSGRGSAAAFALAGLVGWTALRRRRER